MTTTPAASGEEIAREIVQAHRHVHGAGPAPDALVTLIAVALDRARQQAGEEAAKIADLEAAEREANNFADPWDSGGESSAEKIAAAIRAHFSPVKNV